MFHMKYKDLSGELQLVHLPGNPRVFDINA